MQNGNKKVSTRANNTILTHNYSEKIKVIKILFTNGK